MYHSHVMLPVNWCNIVNVSWWCSQIHIEFQCKPSSRSTVIYSQVNSSVHFCCSFCEEFQRVLGYDWLLLFVQGNLHQSTVVLALSILCRILQHPVLLQSFRDGSNGGGWLKETEPVVQNRIGVLLGECSHLIFNLKIIIFIWINEISRFFMYFILIKLFSLKLFDFFTNWVVCWYIILKICWK